MNSSPTGAEPQDGPPNKKPQIGRREIGAVLLLLAINWTAFFILYPSARIRTLVLVFFVQIPAWVYLGGWFVYQLVDGHAGLTSASAKGGGVAFFAHIGGFVFGALVTLALLNAGRIVSQSTSRHSALGPV